MQTGFPGHNRGKGAKIKKPRRVAFKARCTTCRRRFDRMKDRTMFCCAAGRFCSACWSQK